MSLFKKSLAMIISALLIISMLSASLGMSAFAADAYKITVKSVQNVFNDVSKMYKAGDTFDIKYYVQADVDMYDGEVYLYYDNDSIRIPSKKGAELGAKMSEANITGMGNYDSSKQRYGYVYMPSGYTADYSKEGVLITFHFTVLDSISSDQTINFDIYGLYAIGTKMVDGEEMADVNARTNYIANGKVLSENRSGFKTRVELTGGSEVQPDTQPVTSTEPQTTTAPVTTVPQTTAAPSATAAPTTASGIYGDANGDNRISIGDVTLIQKHMVNLASMTSEAQARCDVNGDSKMNIKDATCIQKYLAKFKDGVGITGEPFSS